MDFDSIKLRHSGSNWKSFVLAEVQCMQDN